MTSLPHRSLLASFLALSITGCFGGTGILSFPIERSIDEQLVQGSPLAAIFPFAIPMNVDLASETSARGTGPANHVYLRSLVLDVTSTAEPDGDTDDFDFLTSVDIFIESTKAGSTLPRVRIAHISNVPRDAKHISFVSDRVDLIDYVNEGARLTSEADGSVPPDDVTFDGEIALSVEVL